MKLISSSLLIIFIIVTVGCREASDDSARGQNLNATVGHEIPLETAERWIAKTKSSSSREGTTYNITAPQLENLLQAVPSKIGIAFHHATDDNGVYHILLIPVAEQTDFWNSPTIVDANTNSTVDNETAKAWAKRYKEANPGKVWYHFFGVNMFNEITSNLNFNYFNLAPALNDSDVPQLVLLVWNNKQNSTGGRSKDEGPVAYDDSNRCPPCLFN
jgi:hypothetical protein